MKKIIFLKKEAMTFSGGFVNDFWVQSQAPREKNAFLKVLWEFVFVHTLRSFFHFSLPYPGR